MGGSRTHFTLQAPCPLPPARPMPTCVRCVSLRETCAYHDSSCARTTNTHVHLFLSMRPLLLCTAPLYTGMYSLTQRFPKAGGSRRHASSVAVGKQALTFPTFNRIFSSGPWHSLQHSLASNTACHRTREATRQQRKHKRGNCERGMRRMPTVFHRSRAGAIAGVGGADATSTCRSMWGLCI